MSMGKPSNAQDGGAQTGFFAMDIFLVDELPGDLKQTLWRMVLRNNDEVVL